MYMIGEYPSTSYTISERVYLTGRLLGVIERRRHYHYYPVKFLLCV